MTRMDRTTVALWGTVGAMALTLAACGQAGAGDAAAEAKGTPEAASTAPVTPSAAAVPAAADTSVDDSLPANLATNPETALAAMQGDWTGIEDPKSMLHVAGNQVTMAYAGDAESSETFRLDFVRECEGRAISGPRLGFTLSGDDMLLCYTDLEVDAENLEFFYASRGNRQAFRRASASAAR